MCCVIKGLAVLLFMIWISSGKSVGVSLGLLKLPLRPISPLHSKDTIAFPKPL